jgi:hypothetical protein|tara:strand:- start:456 stop:833 length:378 start_codon:yes stop_codon:yes gene_type:complete
MEYILGIVCFIFGYYTHKFFSAALNLGKMGLAVNAIGFESLRLLATSAENFASIKELRRKVMSESETDKKVVRDVEKLYDDAFRQWKNNAIQSYLQAYPQLFRKQLDFNDWDGAMDHLKKEYKKH